MKTMIIIVLSITIGLGAGVLITPYIDQKEALADADNDQKKPLYWVAPMDANYRRDKPGKSPMGMDLVPVYKEDSGDSHAGPGTITIHPSVVNNLGVRTATAEERPLQQTISTVGYVQYDQDQLIHIHPRVEGWIDKLYVKAAGDPVRQGQALYTLYSPQLVTAQEELLIALNRSNKSLVAAAKDRLKALQLSNAFIQGLIKQRNVQQTVTFYAPQSGVLDTLNIREGFFVKPGTTMMSIGSLDNVWVAAEIFERQASLIKVGLPVVMTLDYKPSQQWQGAIDYIYPTLDAKTRTLRIRLRFTNQDKQLKPNMFARIHIKTHSEGALLVVPSEAVIRTGNQDRVVVSLGEGQFKAIAVRLGQYGDRWTEIVDGIYPGDTVVTSAQFLLDSESSKTSDFKRMHREDGLADSDRPDSVWVAAIIEERLPEQRVVTVSHDAIEAWNMMGMTMNFSVAEPIDIGTLTPGTELHMQITMGKSGMYEIIGTHLMSSGSSEADPR